MFLLVVRLRPLAGSAQRRCPRTM